MQGDGVTTADDVKPWLPPSGKPHRSPRAKNVIWIFLVGGMSYHITYTQGVNRPLLVFGNGGGGTYWAGRGAALLSTKTSKDFAPTTSGDYAFVIANDLAESGSFSLAINTVGTAGVDPGAARFETRPSHWMVSHWLVFPELR